VIPCRNEERNISHVLRALPASVNEVIIVDGDSTDRTVEVVLQVRPDAVIVGQHSPGKGAATIAGLSKATGDIVVMLDGDDSMDPGEISSMVDLLVNGADVVHGSRGMIGGGSSDFTFIRRMGNHALRMMVNRLFRVKWTDVTYGFVALWADVIEELKLPDLINNPASALRDAETGKSTRPVAYGHGFEVEVLLLSRAARAGLVVDETPSFERKRRHGTSNLHAAKDGFRVFLAIMKERFFDHDIWIDLGSVARLQRRQVSSPSTTGDRARLASMTATEVQ
jgi:glycosyltransferase involved in cell wall biosynthesis